MESDCNTWNTVCEKNSKRKRSHGISPSRDSFDDNPHYQEIPEELILNLPSIRIEYSFSSPQPQSENTANSARVNPLPSPATTSSSSGELHLYIDSDTSSPSVHVEPPSSSQEQLLQGDNTLSHPHQSSQFSTQQLPQN